MGLSTLQQTEQPESYPALSPQVALYQPEIATDLTEAAQNTVYWLNGGTDSRNSRLVLNAFRANSQRLSNTEPTPKALGVALLDYDGVVDPYSTNRLSRVTGHVMNIPISERWALEQLRHYAAGKTIISQKYQDIQNFKVAITTDQFRDGMQIAKFFERLNGSVSAWTYFNNHNIPIFGEYTELLEPWRILQNEDLHPTARRLLMNVHNAINFSLGLPYCYWLLEGQVTIESYKAADRAITALQANGVISAFTAMRIRMHISDSLNLGYNDGNIGFFKNREASVEELTNYLIEEFRSGTLPYVMFAGDARRDMNFIARLHTNLVDSGISVVTKPFRISRNHK